MLGNELNIGDVVLEIGGGFRSTMGGTEYSVSVWEVPEIQDGRGMQYSLDGEKSRFWHASSSRGFKLDFSKLPEDFKYSFYHGMNSFYTKTENKDLMEIIEQSDWESNKVSRDRVESFKAISNVKIENMGDIIDNLDILSKGSIPHSIVDSVLTIFNQGRTPVSNGEIGIAAMYDHHKYFSIIKMLKEVESIKEELTKPKEEK